MKHFGTHGLASAGRAPERLLAAFGPNGIVQRSDIGFISPVSLLPWSRLGAQLNTALASTRFVRHKAGPGLAPVVLLSVWGCGFHQAPLAIEMYNPATRQTLICSARDQRPGADTPMLTTAVESCAKALEARGFVRK